MHTAEPVKQHSSLAFKAKGGGGGGARLAFTRTAHPATFTLTGCLMAEQQRYSRPPSRHCMCVPHEEVADAPPNTLVTSS